MKMMSTNDFYLDSTKAGQALTVLQASEAERQARVPQEVLES